MCKRIKEWIKEAWNRVVDYKKKEKRVITDIWSDRFVPECLFSWEKDHGIDSEKLLKFLRDNFDIGWAKNAEIRKSDDDKTIRIFKDENSAKIIIDEKKKKATLKINGGGTHALKVEEKDGKLNIYAKKIIGIEKCFLIFLQFLRLLSLSNIAEVSEETERRYILKEVYVLMWFGFLILLLSLYTLCLWVVIVGIVIYRLFDMFSTQLSAISIDRLKKEKILSLNRSLLLIGINYLEIIVGFAIMYLATGSIRYSNCGNIVKNPLDALYFSIATITTLGCGSIEPIPFSGGRLLVGLELFSGLIIIVLVIGAFFTFYANKK